MTSEYDDDRQPRRPTVWTLEDVAEVQAGLNPPAEQERLLTEIDRDPAARRLLAALNATVDDLSLLAPIPMPEKYAVRLDAALTHEATRALLPAQRSAPPVIRGELSSLLSAPGSAVHPGSVHPGFVQSFRGQPSATGPASPAGPRFTPQLPFVRALPELPRDVRPQPAPPAAGRASINPGEQDQRPATANSPDTVHSLADARRRSSKRRGIVLLGAAAAVAVVAVLTVNAFSGPSTAPPGVAQSGSTTVATAGPSANSVAIDPGDFASAVGKLDGHRSGALANPLIYASCLKANGLAASQVLGLSDVTFRGRPASAILVALSATTSKVLVVAPDCGGPGATGSGLLTSSGTITR